MTPLIIQKWITFILHLKSPVLNSAEYITISGSLSRSGEGDRRVQKGRENGEITVLPLDETLFTMFQSRLTPDAKPDDLIFRTPTGKVSTQHYLLIPI